ncbi:MULTISPECIES: lysophospholipid acyltransferase family protein [Mammaliicoccus]|nr:MULTISPECIES: lysophospholipid acyltransferase family protein [Mammaliicoccus]MBO3077089.1 1-acyl-sn-glycerol-3-phosphate acyltransferase [Mammaliicoccus vitulinus]PTI88709.1 1-acyl-sn-glycerol-3-phosphate acyltransferase [Mammaliicoccus vitulinus]QQT16223.1 1-acyl-sn-glycerol-3-phosphate acyltransferase [Mammaliicoccus vitulinus]QQY18482.1 1-acyl-sn-glycerol-3-phosphate acyltransferase [Mammaliicoccus vitulinus]RIN16785.1 1-acyl-sn-glycerol-3-phosphate acyltransferase [Mammaliicoccus vitul
MLRTAKTIGYIIGYAALVSSQLKKVKIRKTQIDDVRIQDEMVYLYARRWASRILDSAGVKTHVTGNTEPFDEPVLYISNHEGNFDIPVLINNLPQPFGFISKKEVEKIPFLKPWMEEMNCIYLDRSNRRASLQMIKDGINKLKEQHSLLIFPEGSRSKGGEMQEFKAGSLKLAKSAKVKIVPIAIYGSSNIMEKYNSKKMVPGDVYVHILDPIEPTVFEDKTMQEVSQFVQGKISNTVQSLKENHYVKN